MDSSISDTFVIGCYNSLRNKYDKRHVVSVELEINIHILASQSPLPAASTFPTGLRSTDKTAKV